MKIKKYFVVPLLALLACSCQDKEEWTASTQLATGEEVKFGASLGEGTRTIYGDETATGFPIYWKNGDEVIISSPDCGNNGGVGNATYKVSVDDNDPKNYATSIDKTGEIGLRWGDNATGRFYSIYPASANLASDNKTVTLTMPAQQDNGFEIENGVKKFQANMDACFMYAATKNVASGQMVNLNYKPLSTAIRFTLQGPLNEKEVTINYVRLFAPEKTYISGTYDVDLSTVDETTGLPVVKLKEGTGRNYITMNIADDNNAYLTLKQNETMEMNMFLMLEKPITIVSAEGDNWSQKWYFEVGLSSGNVYRKELKGSGEATLVPGKIHRISSPLPPFDNIGGWDPANWMVNLQRNVYLSEISIPGAWYSMHNEYQPESNTIDALYAKGVRAFHLDTRWRGTTRWVIGDTYLREVQDLGVIDNDDHTFNENGVLGGGKYLTMDAPSFENVLSNIVGKLDGKDDEYMVVICTFAQGSGNYEYASGKLWCDKISEICNQGKYEGKIKLATELDQNSTVADVLGKVIVIVNTFQQYSIGNSKCFFMDIPIKQDESVFTSGNYYKEPLKYNNQTSSGITVYGTHAQRTNSDSDGSETNNDDGYVPTISQRKAMINEILNWSAENYRSGGNNEHDIWMYLGLGGYIRQSGGDDYSTVKEELNTLIGNRLENMYSSETFYPIGIVLMNDIAGSNTSADYGIAQRILEMNNLYRKAYDPNRSPVDGKPIDRSVQSAAPGYSSGMTDNRTDAIGWTRVR